MRFIARDRQEYAVLLIAVLEFARLEPEEFSFGPFEEKGLLDEGLVVEPPVARLTKHVRNQFPGVVVRDA